MRKISQAALLAATLGLPAVLGLSTLPVSAEDKDSHASSSEQMDVSSAAAPSDESSSSAEPSPSIDQAVSGFDAKVDIPTIAAIGSSMDEAALRDALGPNILKHVDELAHLNATNITIPQIEATFTSKEGSTDTINHSVYKDIVLSNVKDGMVGTLTIGSATSTATTGSGKPVVWTYKSWSYSNVDIPTAFGFLGLIPGDATAAAKPAIASYSFEGGKLEGDGIACNIGKFEGAATNVKPSPISFADLSAAFNQLKGTSGPDEAPPAAVKTFITYVVDLIRDFDTEPSHFDGLSCTGSGDTSQYSFSLGAVDVGKFSNAVYPEIALKDIKVDAGAQGKFALSGATFKSIDLNPPFDALTGADTLNSKWFETKARLLIPSWAGLSLSGLSIDVPDPETAGARITASMADFDLSMSDYLNGIPTKFSTKASGIDVPLPPDAADDTEKMLLALGITRVNVGFELSASWDKANQAINVDKLAVNGADLGSAAIAIAIGNAPAQLFDLSSDTMLAAAMGVTLKSVKVDLKDDGIGQKLAAQLAQQQNADPSAFRTQIAGTAEAVVLQLLGATPTAQALAQAVGNFVTGSSKSVTVTLTSKDPAGIPVPTLIAAQNDPSVLSSAVDVTGSAQ